ncbi:MAG: hypothetical protein DIU76_03390 [Bacillota bacterium]|nr:MAG: hypothetical protein DIU76_03390 [Bacillota bacterium]
MREEELPDRPKGERAARPILRQEARPILGLEPPMDRSGGWGPRATPKGGETMPKRVELYVQPG